MSHNYKFHNPKGLYFMSFAVVKWLDVSTTLQKNETHIMDNHSHIAVIRTGSAFPDDIAGKYYVLESHLGSGLLRLNTYWGGSVIDREETAFRFAKTAEKKAITEQYYPFGDSSLRTFSKKRFYYVGKEGRRKNRSGRPAFF